VTTQTRPSVDRTDFVPVALAHTVDLPEPLSYRLKNRLLGPPLHNERLAHERLGKPTALAVFASDNLSSSAYATEEILRVLIPVVGVAAFSLVVPLTVAMLVVLGFLILSYRQTIKAYPSAGGAYIVTRDNFGLMPAQVAGVALLTDYILTVAVSVAAGTAALSSAFPALSPYAVPISVSFIAIIAYGNLRGVRESGKVFAVPTYFFIANMVVLLGVGLLRMAVGGLPQETLGQEGMLHAGSASSGVFYGATLFVVLHAFASGGAAVTGVEAISNGVPAFKEPAWRNARSTLVIMGVTLGFMFLGLSVLAAQVHAMPFTEGTPTVISQVGTLVYGEGTLGQVLFYALQAGTMLILVLAANTSFADFPRLASFHAGDNFMPRQLTKRGHRLVFSNGIIALSISSIVLVVVTGAKVDRLIPLYAIGVFTSFTLSQAGMAKHHLTHKERGWRTGFFINGTGAVMTLVVDLIIAVTKFTHGAWVIIILVPVMVLGLVRLNRQYENEAEELERDAPRAAEAPIRHRHAVLVLVDQLDVAAARAIQLARTMSPDEIRAVHCELDPIRSADLADEWRRLGLSRLALEVVECNDRRVTRSIAEVVARQLADGQTEVSVLIPRREYRRAWHRLLHDRTSDAIVQVLATLPHCNVTVVPYHLGEAPPDVALVGATDGRNGNGSGTGNGRKDRTTLVADSVVVPDGCVPISTVRHRRPARVSGRVQAIRVQPRAGVATLECTLADDSGAILVVFLGRRQVPGISVGSRLVVNGVVGDHHGHEAILNPTYELVAGHTVELPPAH
jgi:amino acid transporter